MPEVSFSLLSMWWQLVIGGTKFQTSSFMVPFHARISSQIQCATQVILLLVLDLLKIIWFQICLNCTQRSDIYNANLGGITCNVGRKCHGIVMDNSGEHWP